MSTGVSRKAMPSWHPEEHQEESLQAQLSGSLVGNVILATTSYLADAGTGLTLANLGAAQRYQTPARTIRAMRVTAVARGLSVNMTVTLFKNNVATAMTVTILSTDAAGTKKSDVAHPIAFADTDQYDVQLAAGAGVGTNTVSVTLE